MCRGCLLLEVDCHTCILFEGFDWWCKRGLVLCSLYIWKLLNALQTSFQIIRTFSIFLWSFIVEIVPSAVFCAVPISISFPWRYVARGFVNEKMNFKTSSPKRNWKSQTATNRPRASTLAFQSFYCCTASRWAEFSKSGSALILLLPIDKSKKVAIA